MGLLSQDYFDKLSAEPASTPTPAPTSTPTTTPAAAPAPLQPLQPSPAAPAAGAVASTPNPFQAFVDASKKTGPLAAPGVTPAGPSPMFKADITPEEQTQRFGGPVGSDAYYKYKADHPYTSFLGPQLLSSIGVQLPNSEEWDQMSRTKQGVTLASAGVGAVASMFLNLPKAIVRDVASVGLTAIKPFYNIVTGKASDADSLSAEPKASVPWLGEVPTLYQDVADAQKSGMGPAAATFFGGYNFFLKTATALPVGEVLANTFRPRPSSAVAGEVTNTAPISVARNADGVAVGKTPSTSEYYTLRKTDAKQFGGNPQTVQWKFTPAAEGETTLAVVKQVSKKAEVGSWVKTDFGLKQVTQGDFGPEVKLYSQTVPTGTKGMGASTPVETDLSKVDIPSRPDPGFENKPVTPKQLETLNTIGAVKGMDPALRDTVLRTLSGKQTLGEMTQAQFVKIAQSLGKFGEAYNSALTKVGPTSFVKQWIAPQRHAFDYAEDTFGIPLKSQVYNPMEDAARLSKTLQTSLHQELGDTFGDFAAPKFSAERKLIDSYARGNPAAITENTTLSAEMKASLIDTAKKVIAWDDKNGTVLNVGRDAYLENYGGPKIANISGVVPKYKNLDSFPTKTFFAKEKRGGNLDAYIDDPLASRQIYIKQGADALHYGPALDNIKPLLEAMPGQYKSWADAANSYIQEKLGYQGSMEKLIDSFVPAINAKMGKFGVDLPADASRQAVNYALSSLYSGLVATPKAMFQQIFQYPLFVYPKLGAEFAGEAMVKSFSAAERDRVAAGGWLNSISLPYGEALASEMSPVGKVGNLFKTVTQKTLEPLTSVDNRIRIQTFLQAEMKWNDALNKFNTGKIEWPAVEQKLDFGSFSKADRNSMRQSIIGQNKDAAFNIYMREILDEANVPYRTATGARVGYGLAGKLSTGLLNYTIDTTNTLLGKWFAHGEWDKLIRFAGAAKATDDTMKETYGFDFGNTIYQKFNGLTSPAVGLAMNTYNYLYSLSQNNHKDMNTNRDAIIRTLRSGTPLGVEGRNVEKFWKSINAGPDAQGNYAVYDDSGKLTYNADFSDMFWGTLMGFPTATKVNEQNLYTDLLNAQTDQAETKQKVDQLLREGKYDEMEKVIEATGVMPSSGAMNKSYVPRAQSLFQSLPNNAKPDFIPRVFPDATPAGQ